MKIDKSEYEICVECRVKIEYLTQRLLNGVCPDENELRTLCGLQINKVPDIKPTEPAIMIEAVEESTNESVRRIMERFHSEEESKTPKESIPDKTSAKCIDTNTSRKKVDRGKVMALHKAGWSLSKIADEMGCSAQRVHQIVKEENSK